MADENRKDKSGERRRKLFSINEQIDKIQGVYFDNYTQNIDRRISSLAERQHKLLDKLYDTLEKEERDRIKKSFSDRQEEMRKSLDDWRSYNKQIRSDLTLADKFASDVFYWNRRRNLRDLEREARYRFDDIRDEAEDLADDMSKSFSSVTDSLRDWATALNVNQLASGMEDTQVSMRDIRVDLQKYMDLTDEEWANLRDRANEFSKETDYAISNLEYLENVNAVVKFGYDDQELAAMIAEFTSKFEAMTGVAADQLGNIFEVSMMEGMGGEEYIRTITSQMMKIQQTSGLYTNAEDLMSAYDDNIANLRNLAGGDNDLLATYLDQTMALRTATNASFLDGLDEKLFEMMSTPLSEMSDSMLMIGGAQIQKLMQSGDFKAAAETYVTNLSNYLDKAGNSAQRLELLNALGLDDPELQGKIMEEGNLEEFLSSYDQAMGIIDDQANALSKFVDEWNPQATRLTKLTNQFKTSALGSFLDDVANELDITLAEGMLIASGAIDIGKTLFSGIKGLGKLFGVGKGAAGAGSAAGGSSLFSTLLGSAGSTATGTLAGGSGLLGMFSSAGAALGSGATTAGGLAAAGGSGILGGLLGAVGIGSGIYDIYKGATSDTMSSKEKQDQYFSGGTKIGMVGGGAAAGAAIGSVVPGLGTAIGALIGAGVGGIGALISGTEVGNALSDAWDWTKEKASDLWDNISEWGSNTWNNVKDWAGNTWDTIKTKASDMWTGAKNFGIDAFNTAVGVGDMAMDGLFNMVGLDWDTTKQNISQGWTDIKDWASTKWTEISDWASTKWTEVGDWASSTWDTISTKAGEVWDGVSNKAGEIWDGITDKASSAWDAVSNKAKEISEDIGDFFSETWDGITEGLNSAGEWISDKAGKAWDGITGFFSGAKDRGEEITGISGSHALGLRYVPYDGYLAELHEGEAVLTEAQATNWRNGSLDATTDASWAPNDKSSTLTPNEATVVNNYYTEVSTPEEDDDDDATLSEVIDTLKWLGKELKKTIKENASNSDNNQQNSLLQQLLNTRSRNTQSDAVFNFVK